MCNAIKDHQEHHAQAIDLISPCTQTQNFGCLRIIFSFLNRSISEGKARFLLHVFISPWMEFILQKCELLPCVLHPPYISPLGLLPVWFHLCAIYLRGPF